MGIFCGLLSGKAEQLSEASMTAVTDAVSLAIRLAGGFALWNGLMAILEKSGALKGVCRLLSPVLSWLFPGLAKDDPAREAIALNLSANMLGLGNAATPSGIRAMRILSRDEEKQASNEMCMFLVLNAASLQFFPSTVISIRAAAGAAEAASVVLPVLLASAVSAAVGVVCCKGLERRGKRRE